MATEADTQYDVAIIGSGIAGSALGAILARHGQKVILFEAKSHPRFAIGESLILETSEMMRALAHFFDVPELAYFSSENYQAYFGTTHGVKRHFGFLHHTPGAPHDPARTLQAVIPKEPHGHELHLYRQDTDSFMVTTAVHYGAEVRQNTPVQDIRLGAEQIEIVAADGTAVTAAYVVDGGGYRSLLADKFNLRDTELQAHSRALFTHMTDVAPYHRVNASQAAYGLPFPMDEGTLHHVFAGGWLWVIPFNNHPRATNPLCSVGLMLDPRQHPQRGDLAPEAEFQTFIDQFPAVKAQFAQAAPVRAWTRTGRIQYTSKQVVGERWALLGHAAGFIDPLYSKGLYSSFAAVFVLAYLLLHARQTGDYSAAAFAPLEKLSRSFVRSADRLVANSYKAFGNFALWQTYAVVWLLGAYTEYLKLNMLRAQAGDDRDAYFAQFKELKLVGGGFAAFAAVADQVDALVEGVDVDDATAVAQTTAQIKSILSGLAWMPRPFHALLAGKTHLPKNKLRPGLLRRDAGFMGSGAYRDHFFGALTLTDLLRYGLHEKLYYAAPLLTWRQRRGYRR